MLNKIILQGRLTKDFELRYTQSNTAVAGGTLAVQRSRKDAGGKYPSDFIDVVLWSRLAEHAHTWFHKGDMCIVSGRLESRDWEDKNGNKRRSWEVQCESIDFCGGKSEGKPKEEESDFIMSDESDFIMSDESDQGDVPF